MNEELLVSRRVIFSAAHRLHNPKWSEEKNKTMFHKCYNLHGHNYTLEVFVKGSPDPETGFVIDFKDLDAIIDLHVLKKVDHVYLNDDVPEFNGKQTTVENLAIIIWNYVHPHLPKIVTLAEVRLWESENNSTIYRG
ncbi:6-carboxytetrahydropterin synthase [bacterium]|jgi:6-pyruvoyltetrahydropterin/6-carboxytetrahydropterin synthase|nr:6-carboxytetrahydropterin synthase [bacterium]